MVSDNVQEYLVKVELSKEEQQAILQHCQLLEPHTQRKIESSTDGTVCLLDYEADILVAGLCYTTQKINDEKIKSLFNRLTDRIPISPSTLEYLEKFTRVDYKDPEVFRKVRDEIDEERKNTPNRHMGNLTPTQLKRLQYAKWGDENCVVQFNRNLPLDDLKQSKFFSNTRLFLKKLLGLRNEATATVRGNLNRKFVKLMYEDMEREDDYKDTFLRNKKVLNEKDVRPLHKIRIVCELAGLIHKCPKRFLVSEEHEHLLSDENAGELYYLLFKTYFRKFNLGYMDRIPELEGIQETFDYSLYRLSVICDDYQTLEQLFQKIFLPTVSEEIREERSTIREIGWLIELRIVRPLADLGLIDCKIKKEKYFNQVVAIKKSNLFDKFIRYEW